MLREELPSIDQIKRVNKRLSIRYSLPVWLVKKLLMDEYGEQRAIAIFESLYVRNKASVRVVDLDQKEDIRSNCRLILIGFNCPRKGEWLFCGL